MKRTHCIALATLALGVLVAVPDAQAQTKKISYAITELPALSDVDSFAFGINNLGEVVGSSYEADGIGHACHWKRINGQWVINDLRPLLPHHQSTARSINDLGQIVGYSAYTSTSGKFTKEPFYYDILTGVTSFPLEEDVYEVTMTTINNLGQVVGNQIQFYNVGETVGTETLAYLWEYSEEHNDWVGASLRPFPDCNSIAGHINNLGQVVGVSRIEPHSTYRAGLWENVGGIWTFTNLNDVGGSAPQSSANCINELGQIVGTRYTDGTSYYAVLWERINGQWTVRDLSVAKPSGFSNTSPSAINNSGQVVGRGGESLPFLYQDGVMYNLNSFVPTGLGWSLWSANDINDNGQIVGRGLSPAGIKRAFLMDTRAVTYSYSSNYLFPPKIRDNSTASQSMTLTDNVKITDLNVRVMLTHSQFSDLKFELVGPDNVTRLLRDVGTVAGSVASPYSVALVFDDEGAAGSLVPAMPLSYYDSKSTKGKWTLKISDKVKNNKTGTFWYFTLDVMPQL